MEIISVVKELSELGLSPFNLILLGILYSLGIQTGLFPRFWKTETEEDKTPTLRDIHSIMLHLKEHYNDETTDNLEKIGENQKDMIRGITKISISQDGIKEEVSRVKRFHEEYAEYGIKTRKGT